MQDIKDIYASTPWPWPWKPPPRSSRSGQKAAEEVGNPSLLPLTCLPLGKQYHPLNGTWSHYSCGPPPTLGPRMIEDMKSPNHQFSCDISRLKGQFGKFWHHWICQERSPQPVLHRLQHTWQERPVGRGWIGGWQDSIYCIWRGVGAG